MAGATTKLLLFAYLVVLFSQVIQFLICFRSIIICVFKVAYGFESEKHSNPLGKVIVLFYNKF
jgi:hypothetical protein